MEPPAHVQADKFKDNSRMAQSKARPYGRGSFSSQMLRVQMPHIARDSSVTFPGLLSMGELQDFPLFRLYTHSVKLVQYIAGWFPECGKVFPGYIFQINSSTLGSTCIFTPRPENADFPLVSSSIPNSDSVGKSFFCYKRRRWMLCLTTQNKPSIRKGFSTSLSLFACWFFFLL